MEYARQAFFAGEQFLHGTLFDVALFPLKCIDDTGLEWLLSQPSAGLLGVSSLRNTGRH